MSRSVFRPVLEDLDWLWNDWWLGDTDALTAGHLRRGSAALSLLLVEGTLGKAWRHYGFPKQPSIEAPDLAALAREGENHLELATGAIAGGGRQNGIDVAFIGAFRVDNPTTGVTADAAEGSTVEVVSVARLADTRAPRGPLLPLINRSWSVSEYLESPSAVRRGRIISRKDVIQYFRNFAGGAHLDSVSGRGRRENRPQHELVAELQRSVLADVRDGLHFELLSIGQAVAKSPDMRTLADRIRDDE